MSRWIGLAVLAALGAMAFSAVMASGASAKGITAFTCVETTEGAEFENAHCNPSGPSEGKHWKHVAIAQNETTQLTLTAIGTAELKTKIGLASVVLKATGVECVACHFTNEVGENGMTIGRNGGVITYSGVTINVASCKVAEGMITTEPEQTIGSMTEENGPILAEIKPVSGTTVAVVHLEKAGAEPCSLGSSITVTGHSTAKDRGSTASFATGAGELLIGSQKAELIGEVTTSGGLTGGTHVPVSATTTAT